MRAKTAGSWMWALGLFAFLLSLVAASTHTGPDALDCGSVRNPGMDREAPACEASLFNTTELADGLLVWAVLLVILGTVTYLAGTLTVRLRGSSALPAPGHPGRYPGYAPVPAGNGPAAGAFQNGLYPDQQAATQAKHEAPHAPAPAQAPAPGGGEEQMAARMRRLDESIEASIGTDDLVAKLERYAQLRNRGAITEAEYEHAKTLLLGPA